MDMVGKKVSHAIFGDGKVVEQDDISIVIDFSGETKRFLYPQAFDSHLIATDDEIHETLSEQAEQMITEEERQIQEEMEQRRRARLSDPDVIAKRERARRSSAAGRQKDIAFRYEDVVLAREAEASEEADADTEEAATEGLPIIYEWKADAGHYKSGKREGQPIVMREAKRNSLAMLTYVEPDQDESERVIFAVFLADDAHEGDDKEPGYLESTSKYRLKLTEEEAGKTLYWHYYANKNRSPRTTWGSGQFRYIDQPMAAQVMRDIMKLKEGTEDEALAKEFYEHLIEIQNITEDLIPEPEGALTIRAEEAKAAEEEAAKAV